MFFGPGAGEEEEDLVYISDFVFVLKNLVYV